VAGALELVLGEDQVAPAVGGDAGGGQDDVIERGAQPMRSGSPSLPARARACRRWRRRGALADHVDPARPAVEGDGQADRRQRGRVGAARRAAQAVAREGLGAAADGVELGGPAREQLAMPASATSPNTPTGAWPVSRASFHTAVTAAASRLAGEVALERGAGEVGAGQRVDGQRLLVVIEALVVVVVVQAAPPWPSPGARSRGTRAGA
jgi:hypothetical protein